MNEHTFEGQRGDEAPPRRGIRPEPLRTQPIRSPSGVFGGVKAGEANAARGEASAPPDAELGEQDPTNSTAAGAVSGADAIPSSILRAVAAGYRVVDEQLRQGRQAAQDLWSATPKAAASADESRQPHDSSASDVTQLGERWLRSVGELGISWLELMQAMSRATPERATEGGDERTAGPFAAGQAAPSGGSNRPSEPAAPKLSIVIVSPRPVELQVDLERVPAQGELRISPLVDPTGDLPSIRGVTLRRVVEPQTHEARLRLEAVVDAAQPCGSYHGVVLSAERSQPVGTLSLHVR